MDSLFKCTRCGESKEAKSFPLDKRKEPYKPRNYCYKCSAISNRKSRQKTQEVYNAKARARRNERKLRAIEYKGGVCVDCKGVFHTAAFDFHHLEPTNKENDPGLLMGLTDEKLFVELDKCVLLCANCHRIRHFNDV